MKKKALNGSQNNYTIAEQELLAIFYTFEKFWAQLQCTKVVFHTNHTALSYLIAKKDSNTRLIRCVFLLKEFDFEVKYWKGYKNLVADHLSKLENQGKMMDELEIYDSFLNEQVLDATLDLVQWYIDFTNYLVREMIQKDLTFYQRKKFLHDVNNYFQGELILLDCMLKISFKDVWKRWKY